MAVNDMTDGNPDGWRVGKSITDKIGFWGKTPTTPMAAQTLATAATIGTVKTTIQTLLAALKARGLMLP